MSAPTKKTSDDVYEPVYLDSDSDSDSYSSKATYTMETRRQSDFPRTAKKSTTSESKPKQHTSNYSTRRQAALAAKAAEKFMENFDPDTSLRERRKIHRKIAPARRIPGALYDEAGIHINTELDLCDCLQKSCPGCHFPCKKCSSQKCGVECRSNRKYMYDEVEYHGYDFIVKNPTTSNSNM